MTEMSEILRLMNRAFRDEPFHTLGMLYGAEVAGQLAGGTCSDKTLSFLDASRAAGIKARLWTAFIGGKEIHRLVCLTLAGRSYFADVGNGWPSLIPYPDDESIIYERFGMTFRSEISDDRLSIFHKKDGTEYLQMEIMLSPRLEEEILSEIENRFTSGTIYPFENRMRFSAVVDNEFRFLRDNQILIYDDLGLKNRISVSENQMETVISEYFRCSVDLSAGKRDA